MMSEGEKKNLKPFLVDKGKTQTLIILSSTYELKLKASYQKIKIKM